MGTYHGRHRRSQKRRREIFINRILFSIFLLALLTLTVWGIFTLAEHFSGESVSSVPTQSVAVSSEALPPPVESEPDTPEASPQQQAEAQEAQWAENASAFFNDLTSKSEFSSLSLTVAEGLPYLICVNRDASTATVYTDDGSGEYRKPYMAMVCSGGSDTLTGVFSTPVDYPWRLLAGNVYGQYATRIYDCYLFHSVPYYTQHKDDLEYDEFNKLGTPASLGCIRLAVVDVKWIYDNCPLGTPVVIYDDAENPGPMGKPDIITVDPADEDKRGWDPTDPDSANPYGNTYKAGTAIRSAAAQADWEAAQESGAWQNSITPTNLQGWSHDSAIVGTAG